MLRVGIHQINYFPWIGYFNKMSKSDVFVFLDEVQLADRGRTPRTLLLDQNGQEKYITVGYEKKGHREKKFNEVLLSDTDWKERQLNFLKGNYAKHPFYKETIDLFESVIDGDHKTLQDVSYQGVCAVKDALGIHTETVMQSSLGYDEDAQKSDLMLALTKACHGDVYLSGNGSRKYMDLSVFSAQQVSVQYLTFKPFYYDQYKMTEFHPGLSVLDLFFNVGIDAAKDLFWEHLQTYEKNEEM